jgi:hypothetical protein
VSAPQRGTIYLPNSALQDVKQRQIIEQAPQTTCPAARTGRYADSGNLFLHCGIEKKHFAALDSPAGFLSFCCGDYTRCPSWQAEKTGDAVIQRVAHATERNQVERVTERQVASGLRVDDRGEREAEQIAGEVARHRAEHGDADGPL